MKLCTARSESGILSGLCKIIAVLIHFSLNYSLGSSPVWCIGFGRNLTASYEGSQARTGLLKRPPEHHNHRDSPADRVVASSETHSPSLDDHPEMSISAGSVLSTPTTDKFRACRGGCDVPSSDSFPRRLTIVCTRLQCPSRGWCPSGCIVNMLLSSGSVSPLVWYGTGLGRRQSPSLGNHSEILRDCLRRHWLPCVFRC